MATKPCEVQLDNSGDVWFESSENLTEDAEGDPRPGYGTFYIYERTDGKTVLVSRMPDGRPIPPENRSRVAAYLSAVSPDGKRLYLSTDTSLLPGDTDGGHELSSLDYYEIHNGHYTLLSTGPLDRQGGIPAPLFGQMGRSMVSDNGQYFYWVTSQALVPEDTDEAMDVYQRHDGQVRLVSVGRTESTLHKEFPWMKLNAELLGISPDGSTAYFETEDRLTPDDSAEHTDDLFSWHDGVTTRITKATSTSAGFGRGSIVPLADGSVLFASSVPQTSDDTDQYVDLYRANPDGSIVRPTSWPPGGPGNPLFDLEAASRDGTRVLIKTTRAILPSDQDSEEDLYMWSAEGFERVTPDGPKDDPHAEMEPCAMSADGRRVYFDTRERLSPLDTDSKSDVYEWSERSIRLVTPRSDGRPTNTDCLGISPNGRYVAFSTNEQLNQEDHDANADTYVIDMEGSRSGRVTAASLRAAHPHRRHHRIWLVTAESIAPRMTIARAGVLTTGGASVRLTCPKSEQSGPCHGRVRLLGVKSHRVLASGRFRIPVGKSEPVPLRRRELPHRAAVVRARVTGVDRLGNRKTITVSLSLRHSS